MNAAMTYNGPAINLSLAKRHSFLGSIRNFFKAMLETNAETPYDLPADAAARLYL